MPLATQIAAYNAAQQELYTTHQQLVAQYTDTRFGMRAMDMELETKLTQVERTMLANPPYYEERDDAGQPTGTWQQRRPGLLLPEQSPLTPEAREELFGSPKPLSVAAWPRGDFAVIPQRDWADYLTGQDAVDLALMVKVILSQGSVGSCGSEGLTQALMISRAFTSQEHETLNPWFMYHTTSGGSDRGSSLPDNVQFAMKYGVASEVVWPRSKGWRATPSETAYTDAKKYVLLELYQVRNWEEFGTALLSGWPVYFGYSGHAIVAVKLLSTSRFVYANSWSAEWGDKGFGVWATYAEVNWQYGAFAIRTTTEVKQP